MRLPVLQQRAICPSAYMFKMLLGQPWWSLNERHLAISTSVKSCLGGSEPSFVLPTPTQQVSVTFPLCFYSSNFSLKPYWGGVDTFWCLQQQEPKQVVINICPVWAARPRISRTNRSSFPKYPPARGPGCSKAIHYVAPSVWQTGCTFAESWIILPLFTSFLFPPLLPRSSNWGWFERCRHPQKQCSTMRPRLTFVKLLQLKPAGAERAEGRQT